MLAAFIICVILYNRWAIRHLHHDFYMIRYKIGDVINWKGWPATVIQVSSFDMIIRRHIRGLFLGRVWK